MKKNDKLIINCSSEFKETLKVRAEQCEMNLTAYCLFILKNARPKVEEV